MKAKIAKQPPVRRLTAKQRLDELRHFIALAFGVILEEETDYKEIANRTGLCTSTLYRVQSDELTLAVRFGTIQAIGYAAGMKLELTETGAKIVLVD